MKSRKKRIPLKAGIYGMEGRIVGSNRNPLKIQIAIFAALVGSGIYFKGSNTQNSGQQDPIENKGFQQEYQETPEFVKDSLIHLFNTEQDISFENGEESK